LWAVCRITFRQSWVEQAAVELKPRSPRANESIAFRLYFSELVFIWNWMEIDKLLCRAIYSLHWTNLIRNQIEWLRNRFGNSDETISVAPLCFLHEKEDCLSLFILSLKGSKLNMSEMKRFLHCYHTYFAAKCKFDNQKLFKGRYLRRKHWA
jgi:hypothetical protein